MKTNVSASSPIWVIFPFLIKIFIEFYNIYYSIYSILEIHIITQDVILKLNFLL